MSRTRNRMYLERVLRGWTQSELAELAERSALTQSAVSSYERGEIFPEPKAIAALAGVFGVSESTVYEWLRTPAISPSDQDETAAVEVSR